MFGMIGLHNLREKVEKWLKYAGTPEQQLVHAVKARKKVNTATFSLSSKSVVNHYGFITLQIEFPSDVIFPYTAKSVWFEQNWTKWQNHLKFLAYGNRWIRSIHVFFFIHILNNVSYEEKERNMDGQARTHTMLPDDSVTYWHTTRHTLDSLSSYINACMSGACLHRICIILLWYNFQINEMCVI